MKDSTTEAALEKAHHHLADDLVNLSQLIQPENQQALGMLYRVQRRLQDIEELVKHASKSPAAATTTPDDGDDDTPKGLVGLFPDDTLAHVSDALVVLVHVNYEDCGSDDDFKCGVMRILNCAIEALGYEVGRVEALRRSS